MKLTTFSTAKLLSDRCRGWLMEDEALNNGMIGALDLLTADSSVYAPPFWFAVVEDEGNIVGVAMHTKPDGLTMTQLPTEIVPEVFESVDQVVGPPHRILAPLDESKWLSAKWVEKREQRRELQMIWNVYVLYPTTRPEKDAPGSLRLATEEDSETAKRWGHDYGQEKPAPVDVGEFMLRKLRRGELFVWDNEGATTLLALSGITENGVRISAVYTPEQHRGNGYGSAAVANMCCEQFDKGKKYVTLTAVEGDPAERIYQRLGFEKIGARGCYNLHPLLHDMQ